MNNIIHLNIRNMKKMMSAFVALFVLMFGVQAQTYYVSKTTGSNGNDGLSAATPKKNLQKALDVAPAGAKILVAEGNYVGTLDCGNIFIKKSCYDRGWICDGF